jgi:hypothetical protein
LGEDPDTVMKNFTAADGKAFFDWIKENFRHSIKSYRSLGTYWRNLKQIYYKTNKKEMDPDMAKDLVNVSEGSPICSKLQKLHAFLAYTRCYLVQGSCEQGYGPSNASQT